MSVISCNTSDITQLNEQIYRIRFKPQVELKFKGGQYLLLLMPDGRKIPLSIASAPEEKAFVELHIRLTSDVGLPAEMLSVFQSSEPFQIDAPHGRCFLNEKSKNDVVIIAGGTGFSPMKSLIESFIANAIPRNISLYLGAQSSQDLYLQSLAEKLSRENENFQFIPVINQAEPEWSGHTGYPHEIALKQLQQSDKEHDFYIGGSEAMVMAVYKALKQAGVSSDRIFSDILDIKRDLGEVL